MTDQIDQLTQEPTEPSVVSPPQTPGGFNLVKKQWRRASGVTRLLTVSGVVMAVALPFGLVPRVLQAHELDTNQAHAMAALPMVTITRAEIASSDRDVALPGTIEALLETPVYARSNGYVRQRFADIGDRVSAGQLLADLETPEIDQSEKEAQAQLLTTFAGKAQNEANRERARADIDRAIADLSQAKATLAERLSDEKFGLSTYKRWKVLGEQGAVSSQEVDERETKYKTSLAAREAASQRVHAAESEVVAARARLKAEQAGVNLSDAQIAAARAHAGRSATESGFQHVASPFTGIITERNVEQGMLVSLGSDSSKLPMYKVARIDTVKVFVEVPQYAAVGVRTGLPVKVALKEFPGKTFTGEVARTAVAMDPTSRTMRAEIHIPNPGFVLSPGMYADVKFSVARTGVRFLIPANALVMRAAGPQVVTLDSNKTVHYHPVQLGEDFGKQIEVLHGLSAKDDIILNPADTLSEGTKVIIKS